MSTAAIVGTRHVYFIGPESGLGPVKIGIAWRPDVRLRELQVGHPERLYLFAAVEGTTFDENHLHEAFAESRIHGEWFSLTRRLADLIEALRYIGDAPADLRWVTQRPRWPTEDVLAYEAERLAKKLGVAAPP